MKEKAVWLRKMEQTVGPVKEAYDYVDAESGEYAYTHLLLESGEDRSCWKRSEEYAKQGYGGYYDYPVYSPDLQAIRSANRVYLCQRERDARAMYAKKIRNVRINGRINTYGAIFWEYNSFLKPHFWFKSVHPPLCIGLTILILLVALSETGIPESGKAYWSA